MAQHDYIIANQSGAAFRSDLNNGLAAIVSNNSGAAQPSTTYAYQWWSDTTTGLLKLRNAANNAWITIGTLADANLGLLSRNGGIILNQGGTSFLEIGTGTNTSQSAYIDLVGDTTYTDYGLRLIRNSSGANANSELRHKGTGTFSLITEEAAPIAILTNGVERVEFGTSEVVFNDGGADVDFRVEGDTKANLLLVDAGADTVSIDGTQQLANQTPLRFGDSDNSHYVALRSPATVAANVTWDLPATDGTASQALTTNGSSVLGWSTILTQGTAITAGTSVASTSGTSIDFTSIPSWVKRVTVMFSGVSTNGGSDLLVQIGAGSVTTSGYVSTSVSVATSNSTSGASSTAGFNISNGSASYIFHGQMVLTTLGTNIWTSGHLVRLLTTNTQNGAGSVTLGGTLDRVRITTVNGTDTFDAGTINILWEG